MRRRDAVIFDLDGTLLDTIVDIAEATNRVLAARGLAPFTVDETKLLVGDGIEEMIRRSFALRGVNSLSAADVKAIIEDYRREYQACWRENSRPYAGIPELLAELARRRVRTAVLSNKSDIYTARMTDALLAGHRFEIVRGAVPGIPLKPDPSAALAIAAGLGVEPGACAFVGDTSIDMATARAAGMFPVGALWGFRTADELQGSGAAALIASPLDLLSLL
jgi:phosphoglycolate phosphatase